MPPDTRVRIDATTQMRVAVAFAITCLAVACGGRLNLGGKAPSDAAGNADIAGGDSLQPASEASPNSTEWDAASDSADASADATDWDVVEGSYPADRALDADGPNYSQCGAAPAGTFGPTSVVGAPQGRFQHAMVWTGTEMVTWGGLGFQQPSGVMCTTCTCFNTELSTGGRYDPVANTWRPMTSQGAPEPRSQPATVWTGTEMLVWGGLSISYSYCANATFIAHNTGGRYNPLTDTWRPTSTVGAPAARFFVPAIFTGKEMIIWGGTDYGPQGPFQTGGRYDPATDTWRPTSLVGAPSARYGLALAWTGSQMVVFGGYGPENGGYFLHNDGALYDPSTDQWKPMSQTGAPQLSNPQAFWTGSDLLVSDANLTGARYNPNTDTWSVIAPPCDSRESAVMFYTGTELIAMGGRITQLTSPLCVEVCPSTPADSILRYNPTSDTWREAPTQIDVVTMLPPQSAWVWTGTELVLWGGSKGLGGTSNGLIFTP